MKAKNVLLSGILGVALAGVVLTGCHKDSTAPSSTTTSNNGGSDYSAAEDESNASDAMNDSKTISDAAAQGSASSKYSPGHNMQAIYSAHCVVTFAHDTAIYGFDTMYVNFGSSPVQCNDNRWRQGEIIVYWARNTGTLLQSYFDSGSTITMTFKNYAAGNLQTNMIGIAGTRAWTNTGENALLQQNWNFTASLTLTYPNSQTATWNSTRTNTLVQINSVYYYEITGSAAGTNRNGNGYTSTITSPLYVTAFPWWLGGCAWIESGTIYVTLTNHQNANISVNFGNVGTCDDVAVATINNTNYTYYMW